MGTIAEVIGAVREAIGACVALVEKSVSVDVVEAERPSARRGLILRGDQKFEDLTDKESAREQFLYDLEEKRGVGPRRIAVKHVAQTLDGFTDYVNRHKGATTAISAQGGLAPKLVATIDFHGESDGESGPDPRWCLHTVEYAFPFALAFQQWQAAATPVDKKRFLDWVETHAVELAHPSEITETGTLTADIFHKVLIVRGWDKAKRQAAFDNDGLSAVFGGANQLFAGAKLMNGTTVEKLEEVIDDMGLVSVTYSRSDKVENASAPRYYLADVKVFDGDADKQCVPVRLDLSVDSGRLALSLHLIGVEQIVEASFVEACEAVKEATGIDPIRAVF
jgi:hypothetical protein